MIDRSWPAAVILLGLLTDRSRCKQAIKKFTGEALRRTALLIRTPIALPGFCVRFVYDFIALSTTLLPCLRLYWQRTLPLID